MSHIPKTAWLICTCLALAAFIDFWIALMRAQPGEIAGALGSLVGGVIGALGAAFAVYLTLQGQRDDETEKITTAIIIEIAQLSRFPCEQLAACRRIMTGGEPRIPRQALRAIMQTPTPTLYLSAAEHISRVPRPTLVIAFYMGLVETDKCLNVILEIPSPNIHLTSDDVRGLGVLLINQCFLARQILGQAPVPPGREQHLVTRMLATLIEQLDDELQKSRKVFPTTEEYESAAHA